MQSPWIHCGALSEKLEVQHRLCLKDSNTPETPVHPSMLAAALFTTARKQNQPKRPSREKESYINISYKYTIELDENKENEHMLSFICRFLSFNFSVRAFM